MAENGRWGQADGQAIAERVMKAPLIPGLYHASTSITNIPTPAPARFSRILMVGQDQAAHDRAEGPEQRDLMAYISTQDGKPPNRLFFWAEPLLATSVPFSHSDEVL